MNNNVQGKKYNFDILKWILTVILLVIIIIGNYYLRQYNFILRITSIIFISGFIGVIILCTTKGKKILIFIRESYIEIYKVIWPKHKETLQITLIVITVITFMALILWGLDNILVRLISFIIGLRF